MVMKRIETMPVPMVTENHDGEKLRTMRRQPRSYLVGERSGGLLEGILSEAPEGSVTSSVSSEWGRRWWW